MFESNARGRVIALTVATVLAVPATAAASPLLSFPAGKQAIHRHAYVVTQQASADRFGVSGCFRIASGHIACYVTVYDVGGFGVRCSFYSHAYRYRRGGRIRLGDSPFRCKKG